MKKLTTLKLFAFASLAIAPSAFGDIIYQDDFESYSAGDNASTWSATGVWAGNTGSAAVNANNSIGGNNLANFTTGTGFNFLNTDAIGSSSNPSCRCWGLGST